MNKLLIVGLAVFLAIFGFKPVYAANIAGNYAVVNVMYVMSQSTAVNHMTKKINAYKEKLAQDAKVKQATLQQEQEILVKKQGEMSPKAFEAAKVEFQRKVQSIQQDFYNKSQNLEKVKEEALASIEKSIGDIVDSISKSSNYDLVFQSASLVRYSTEKDISKQVVAKLNKIAPSVNVKKPF